MLTGGRGRFRSEVNSFWFVALWSVKHETSAETDWARAERRLIFVKCVRSVVSRLHGFRRRFHTNWQISLIHFYQTVNDSTCLYQIKRWAQTHKEPRGRVTCSQHTRRVCEQLKHFVQNMLFDVVYFRLISFNICYKRWNVSSHTLNLCVFISRRTNETFKDRRTRRNINQLLKLTLVY